MVNPRHQTPQGQSVVSLEHPCIISWASRESKYGINESECNMFNPIWYSRRMSKYITYIDAVLPIYTFKDGLTTVSSMIFIRRMSIVNARTRKEGLYIHDFDVIEMEPVLTWNCNSSKMTSWRPSAFWITSPQRDCTWVMRNFEVFVVVGLKCQLEKQSSCRWFETPLHSCDVHAISFSWCHYMMLSGRIHAPLIQTAHGGM